MPNIKPVSDLRNYTEVLKEVAVNNPVYLTKNGRGEFAIVKLEEYDKLRAAVRLMSKLEEGENSARDKGWISSNEVESILGV
ncbi:prevent-host-death protein [Clostridium zeae]|uniref:Antitoxin n=1 Tax=Clostridium zeae TaxID=2759022 RepID=A0ABQ1E614_9CLOT|nr:type II toxin-antitoxin system prevent-host-death family antitoxin [Clostridium zeae]GFZ30141.1 prevent-host-death protein [Clostridium zeae]